jgi:hypothetical protein
MKRALKINDKYFLFFKAKDITKLVKKIITDKNEKYYNAMQKKFSTKDGGYILDSSLPNPIFAEYGSTKKEENNIRKINEKNLNKYLGI